MAILSLNMYNLVGIAGLFNMRFLRVLYMQLGIRKGRRLVVEPSPFVAREQRCVLIGCFQSKIE
jgi:hypothetical protein